MKDIIIFKDNNKNNTVSFKKNSFKAIIKLFYYNILEYIFKKHTILIILILYYTILFCIEPIIRQPLYNFSLNFIRNYHRKFSDKSSLIYKICILLSYVPKEHVIITLFLIIYNTCNLMKTFSFMLVNTTAIGVIGFLKLIYKNPRPIWENDKYILTISCEGSYGNPSGHAYTSALFSLSIYHITVLSSTYLCHNFHYNLDNQIYKKLNSILNNRNNNIDLLKKDFLENNLKKLNIINNLKINLNNKNYKDNTVDINCKFNIYHITRADALKYKIILLILFLLLAISVSFSRVTLGNHSFNQILFGFLLGVGHYLLIFHYIFSNIDLNKSDWLEKIIFYKYTCYISILITSIYLTTVILIYFFDFNAEKEELFNNTINKICPYVPQYKRLSKECLYAIVNALAFNSMFLAIKLEFYISFNSNLKFWRMYNFETIADCIYKSHILLNKSSMIETSNYKNYNTISNININNTDNLMLNFENNKKNLNDLEINNSNLNKYNKNNNLYNNYKSIISNLNQKIELNSLEIEDNNLYDEYDNLINCLMWNNTSLVLTLARFLVLILFSLIIALPVFLISENNYPLIIYLFKYFLPGNIVVLYIFYIHKKICHYLKLTSIDNMYFLRNIICKFR